MLVRYSKAAISSALLLWACCTGTTDAAFCRRKTAAQVDTGNDNARHRGRIMGSMSATATSTTTGDAAMIKNKNSVKETTTSSRDLAPCPPVTFLCAPSVHLATLDQATSAGGAETNYYAVAANGSPICSTTDKTVLQLADVFVCSSQIGSVQFQLKHDGKGIRGFTEQFAPYTVFGDDPTQGTFNARVLGTGTYSLTITIRTSTRCPLWSQTIAFDVVACTDPPTMPPTDPPTDGGPTPFPTEPPTEPPTESPTLAPTEPPTEPPYECYFTDPPTEPPTIFPTEPPSIPPTEPPTPYPTEPPTPYPTEPPTEPPTPSPEYYSPDAASIDPTPGATVTPTLIPTYDPTHVHYPAPTEPPTEELPTHPPTEDPTHAESIRPTEPPTML